MLDRPLKYRRAWFGEWEVGERVVYEAGIDTWAGAMDYPGWVVPARWEYTTRLIEDRRSRTDERLS
jgi:hypothetical protein